MSFEREPAGIPDIIGCIQTCVQMSGTRGNLVLFGQVDLSNVNLLIPWDRHISGY